MHYRVVHEPPLVVYSDGARRVMCTIGRWDTCFKLDVHHHCRRPSTARPCMSANPTVNAAEDAHIMFAQLQLHQHECQQHEAVCEQWQTLRCQSLAPVLPNVPVSELNSAMLRAREMTDPRGVEWVT